MLPGETIQSFLPQDIPWWMPDHAIFMGAFYLALIIIASGVGFVVLKSIKDSFSESDGHGDHGHH
ncbi:hypothetical protein SAMN05660653_01896 [Desulfonatronum thiosulfatophilum]|uniref:Uncharacterized protein n=1 Tax=Desulfonatronum thiosulfatophilum TaxID=617002 RepID=A0A1G6D411_9BACT|nr:hypothetical protein [Desulfonatronum thiosulfatophilum]SDB39848.1 hypothetical protein SAMN05660653_01896 [Desulfonatronum thiosulfatophilum]